MAKTKKRFVVLDGSSLMFRAFYAMPQLTDTKGEPTGAISGFSNMLTKLIGDLQPDLLLIAFDKSRHTFRTEKYAAYKGNRDKTPEELIAQIPMLQDFAEASGITFLEKENYEADDIIGTLATQAAGEGYDTVVITGDRDALQLVRENLRVLLTKKGISELKEYDTAAFTEEYGFEPIKLIDLKGLMGDTADNIPGVPGVGPKTAGKLIIAYGSVENVLDHIPEVKGKKLQERLTENRGQALLSKDLATIELAVPDLNFREEDYAIHPDHAAMRAFCDSYELRGAWRNFTKLYGEEEAELTLGLEAEDVKPADLSYTELRDAADMPAFSDSIGAAGIFAGQVPFEKLTGLAVYDGAKAYYAAAESAVFPKLCDRLEQGVSLFGLKRFYHAGLRPGSHYFDVELAAYLLQPELSHYELSHLAHAHFPSEQVPEDVADAVVQAVWQAQICQRLQPILSQQLGKQALMKLYETIELPLVEVLAGMEQNGVYINRAHLMAEGETVGARIHSLEQDIYTLVGHEFNLNSPKQLGHVLFEEMGLPPIKKTKTGYSTNAEVLETLRYDHPVVEQILQYRMWNKLKSTYLDGLAGIIHEDTGRVYTNFNQTVTATGRLSSSDPNLQNIPVRTEEGKTIRALFEPGEGYDALLSADYSQIELRLLAHISGDENFIDAFRQGQDIHARTASEVFGVPLADVTPEMRRKAKAVNFGIVYGISDYGLSRDLHIPRKEAAHYIATYFERYPGVKQFMDDIVAKAHEQGFVTTLYGRRRSLPAIHSRNFNQRSLAERMAMNTPIQGTAADIIKLAMIRAWNGIRQAGLKSRILLQVHDELVLEVIESEIPQVNAILKEAMEQVAELSVPLSIDIHEGKNWAEAK